MIRIDYYTLISKLISLQFHCPDIRVINEIYLIRKGSQDKRLEVMFHTQMPSLYQIRRLSVKS